MILAMCIITGCGFQLRGSATKVTLADGIEPLSIDKINGPLKFEIQELLASSGTLLSSDINEAKSQLIIMERKSDRRNAALGEGARVIEYQLIESLSFELRGIDGKVLFSSPKFSERKIMENDPNRVSSSAAEERLLRSEMLRRLAASIVRQLGSIRLTIDSTSGEN